LTSNLFWRFLEDVATRCLIVLSLDRFADFR
jgi:hypothetical protein